MKRIATIQYITQDHPLLSHAEQAKRMFENGIKWVQIRMKNNTKQEIIQQARIVLEYAKKYNATVIINDHIDICKEVGAHGVHVGLQDVSVAEARKYLGAHSIIGGTANRIEDIEWHTRNGADYIGLGPFRYTTTKKNLSPIIGLEGYTSLVAEIHTRNITIPIVAVGGITMNDISPIQATGIYGVALSTGLLNSTLKL
ncbi:MAG: thiamine phosphate synthase [Bacteroidales bacterium]